MDTENIELMQEDHLKIIKFLASDLFQHKIMKVIIWITFLTHIGATCITAYYFIYYVSFKEILGFSTIFFAMSYPIFAMFALIFNSKMGDNIKNEIPLWSIKHADETTYKKIRQEILLSTIYVIFNSIVALCSGCIFLNTLFNDVRVFFMIKFFTDYYPCKILCYVYKGTFPVIACCMVAHPHQVVYYTQHFRIQYYMGVKYVANIANIDSDLEKELFYNTRYQEEIRRKLIFSIKRSTDFIQLQLYKVEQIKNFIAGFSVAGCILGVGIILYFFYGDLLTFQNYLRVIVAAIAGCSVFCGVMWSGQSMENCVNDTLSILHEISWYNFNKSNKKIYLIFLINIMKDRCIKFSENYAVNYNLGLEIVKGIYSVISLLVTYK